MKKIVGVIQLLFGLVLICGAVLHLVSLIPSINMAMGGSSSAGIRFLVSIVLVILFSVWGVRSFKAGKARLFSQGDPPAQVAATSAQDTAPQSDSADPHKKP